MSTSTWNPERTFPWLGDSEPCPSRDEREYGRLIEVLRSIRNALDRFAYLAEEPGDQQEANEALSLCDAVLAEGTLVFASTGDELEVACRQLLGAEYGSNAWAESWDNLEAVLARRDCLCGEINARNCPVHQSTTALTAPSDGLP